MSKYKDYEKVGDKYTYIPKKMVLCKQNGVVRFGRIMPINSIYGTISGLAYYCDDLNFFPDGKTMNIWYLVSGKWELNIINSGEIYDKIVCFAKSNHVWGTICENKIGEVKSSYQFDCPTGRKTKIKCLKDANKRHGARGDGTGNDFSVRMGTTMPYWKDAMLCYGSGSKGIEGRRYKDK